MGREFASASARWCHLKDDTIPRPKIVAVCDVHAPAREWFTRNFSSIVFETDDYQTLLSRSDVEAVYCALPHALHAQVYCDILRAGKHLLGEKPFGIDKEANALIRAEAAKHPELLVRCASEYPFFPACQEVIRWICAGRLGQMIEIHAGFNHASDLDPNKPINWKRMVRMNGEYGCLGDLGIHTQHVPFRLGFVPKDVYATFSNIVLERPDGKGGVAPCDTWDNATLICTCVDAAGHDFPMFLETKRLSPGSTNEWFIEACGMNAAIRFTSDDPNAFSYLLCEGKNQAWSRINIGTKPLFPVITGDIFEFGFTDAILQMWASYMTELSGGTPEFGCFTPEETRLSHLLQTAALRAHAEKRVVPLAEEANA